MKNKRKYKVNKSRCAGCGACVRLCPHEAIKIGKDGKAEINLEKCQECDICVDTCPFDVIRPE